MIQHWSAWLCTKIVIILFVFDMKKQKFVAIDEATVMQEIIDERDVEIKKVRFPPLFLRFSSV